MALQLSRSLRGVESDVVTRNALLLGCAHSAAWQLALTAERGDLIGENGRLRACAERSAGRWQLVLEKLFEGNVVTLEAFLKANENRAHLAMHCLRLARGELLQLLRSQ